MFEESSTQPLSRPSSASALSCGLALTLFLACASAAFGQQDRTPKRGFQPGGSYALSDVETINATNGNLILNIPLASLPSGATLTS